MSTKIEEEDEKMKGSMEMLRNRITEEWTYRPYFYQYFNFEESPDWRHSVINIVISREVLEDFLKKCPEYESFKFTIEPLSLGKVKLCNYSELQKITDFSYVNMIQETLYGRLFKGTIGEGSDIQHVIVKTWDFLLPLRVGYFERPHRFCGEIELFTGGKANKHRNLVELYTFCCETRLAAVYVYDTKFTSFLSDVLSTGYFGWDKRIKVAAQIADLFASLHENGVAVGTVTPKCILIDEEVNIKVFDFGYVSNNVNKDSKIPVVDRTVRESWLEAPEVWKGVRTMKSDVYVFGLLLLELINKTDFIIVNCASHIGKSMLKIANGCQKGLVHECFIEVDQETAVEITRLTLCCINSDPIGRPTMEEVSGCLREVMMGANRDKKRKRDVGQELYGLSWLEGKCASL